MIEIIILIMVCLVCVSLSIGGVYFIMSSPTQVLETPASQAAPAASQVPLGPLAPTAIIPFVLSSKNTPPNDYGGGNSIFFDRHDVTCDGVLNELHLSRPTEQQIQWNYTCNNASDIGSPIDSSTPLNDEGGGNTIFLDRHDINCPSGSGIGRFHLSRNGNGKFQIQYNCKQIPNLTNCVNKSTPPNDVGGGNSIFFDRHDIKCDPNQVLQRIHLTRPTEQQIAFDYTCCSR